MPDSSKAPLGADEQNCSDLIRLMVLLSRIFPAYCRAMTAAILAQEEHATNPYLVNDSGFKRLLSFDAMMWLFLIWRSSSHATEKACEDAGVPHGSRLPRVTCNMLGEAAFNDLNLPEDVAMKMGPEGFIMICRRIVEGAIEFKLVTREEVRPNFKPLAATTRLHDLMMSMIEDYGTL